MKIKIFTNAADESLVELENRIDTWLMSSLPTIVTMVQSESVAPSDELFGITITFLFIPKGAR